MRKYLDSYATYNGQRRNFLSIQAAIIDVNKLREHYLKSPDLDKYGYLKQLSSFKKQYVICLNSAQTIDLNTINILFETRSHKPEKHLIFLSDYDHNIIQSNNQNILNLILQNLLKRKNIKTICNPEFSKAKIQITNRIKSMTDYRNESYKLWDIYMAYMILSRQSDVYRLKDIEVMLLPFSSNSLLDYQFREIGYTSSFPFEKLRYRVARTTIRKDVITGMFGEMTRKKKLGLMKIVTTSKPLHDYLKSLYGNENEYYELLIAVPAIRNDLEIPDYWDVDEITADYYYESGQYWLKKANPENYKLFRSFVRKIFQEYKLLSKTRKKIFWILMNKERPILATMALLRGNLSPSEIENLQFSLFDSLRQSQVFEYREEWSKISNQVFEILEVLDPYESIKTLIEKDESEKLEFKSTYRYSLHKKNYDNGLIHEVLKTLSAFLNTSGGMLIIGVSDDKKIIGIEKDGFKSSDKFMLAVEQVMIKFFGKSVASKIKVRIEEYQAKKICIIECEKASEPVIIDHYADKKTKELFFVRTGPSTVQLGLREYQKYLANFKSKN